jgi:twitching motility protein PilT
MFTDIHLKVDDIEKSLVYPGPRLPNDDEKALLLKIKTSLVNSSRDDYMIQIEGLSFRGRRDTRAVDGTWHRMRLMAEIPPTLETLPMPLPKSISKSLLSPHLTRGGLVIVTGGPGCGKTTTGSAVVVSRLVQYGGIAYTVEDPPEQPINGWHGKGYCTQTWVAGDNASDWDESMRGVLRSQPVGTNLMLYVGEVRDAETAYAMLRAASNGFLVIATCFGSDIVGGVSTFFQLMGRDGAAAFAAALRVVVFQNIKQGRFSAEILTSMGSATQVAAIIRSGNLAHLANEINYQKNQSITGNDLFATL